MSEIPLRVIRRFPMLDFVVTTTLPRETIDRILTTAIQEPHGLESALGEAAERLEGHFSSGRFTCRLPGSLLTARPISTIAGELRSTSEATHVSVRVKVWGALIPAACGLITLLAALLSDTGAQAIVAGLGALGVAALLHIAETRRVRLYFSSLLLPSTSPYT
jgi:hypothetical protein